MHQRLYVLGLFALMGVPSAGRAQTAPRTPLAPAPTTKSAVGQFDVAIVRRAHEILSSPDKWNHHDKAPCQAAAATFSIICAVDKAVEEGAGIYRSSARMAPATPEPPITCRFHSAGDRREGSCGTLFDEVPIFSIAPAKAVTTGAWRSDMQPAQVWSGTMADAESPVNSEARQVIGLITTKKYEARLIDFNNDSTVSFADVEKYFRLLEERVAERGAADLDKSGEDVEIEIYAGGSGVIRTYAGWYPVSGFVARDSTMQFQIDVSKQVDPSALDRKLLQRADAIISSDAVWNRADDRKCPASATTWSIYCALEKASLEVAGGFHHRRPASELVRVLVEDRSKGKDYQHRLMGYNNDPSTHLSDVRTLFAEAIARIK